MVDIKKIPFIKDGATKLVDETNEAVIAELTAAGWSSGEAKKAKKAE